MIPHFERRGREAFCAHHHALWILCVVNIVTLRGVVVATHVKRGVIRFVCIFHHRDSRRHISRRIDSTNSICIVAGKQPASVPLVWNSSIAGLSRQRTSELVVKTNSFGTLSHWYFVAD